MLDFVVSVRQVHSSPSRLWVAGKGISLETDN